MNRIGASVQPKGDVHLVRHGETDWNRDGRFQGHSDIPLNKKGREQARHCGRLLAGLFEEPARGGGIPVLYYSPLTRARQSADEIRKIMANQNVEAKPHPALTEVSFGNWEGLTTHEVKDEFPDHRRERKKDRWNFTPPGGESFAARAPEIGNLLASVDRPTIFVCHAGIIRICLYLLGAADLQSALAEPISQERIYTWSNRSLAAQ
ncbi:MAG: histidine phosphatase family protein [Alphaproteobacteria bacterium]|nr:histidine phosphatase family protein [Alphaproteobacteria bacterium]